MKRTIIELAYILVQHQDKIDFQIQFVAYANEEPPFFRTKGMGSYIHAESLHNNGSAVEMMVSLEMIGFFTDEKVQNYPLSLLKLFYPRKGNFIAVISNFKSGSLKRKIRNAINKHSDISCRSLSAPSSVRGVDLSDHRNYWKFGYKAVMITDTSFFRNKNYHQITDTIDTLNFPKMAEVVKGLAYFFINYQ